MLPTGAMALLRQPALPAALGLAMGVVLMLVSRSASRLVTPDDPTLGFTKVAVAMLLRLAVVVAALLVFYVWARPGLVPFGAALVAGFFVMVTVELFGGARAARSFSPRR
jgi:hypothetical protein